MKVRYQEHSWILDSKTFSTYVNESRPKGNTIGSSWGMAQRFTRCASDLDTICTATHNTYKKHYRCTKLLVRNIQRSCLHSTTHTHHNTQNKSLWGMPLYFFDARNLNLRAPIIDNLVCPCSLTTCRIEGQEQLFGHDFHASQDFLELRNLTVRGIKRKLSELPRNHVERTKVA